MNWDAVGAMAETLGAIGVIVSLAYVAIQVKENTRQVRLSRSQDLSATIQDGFEPVYIPENSALWYKGHFSPDELSEEDPYTFHMLLGRQLFNVQNVVYQYQHGLVDEDVYRSTISLLQENLVDTPGGSAYWADQRHHFTEGLRDAVERAT